MIFSQTQSSNQPKQNITADNLSFTHKLQDTIAKIQLTGDFIVTHSDYEEMKVAAYHQDYLNRISVSERDRYLAAQLKQYLYDIFGGNLEPKSNFVLAATNDPHSNLDNEPEQTANYVNKWSRTKFYQQLTQHNHGQGYSDPHWLIVKQEGENHWQVSKNGLTLHIKSEKHLVDPEAKLQVGQVVSLKMPPNSVDHGLYIAIGDAGSTNSSDSDLTVAQLYFNVSSEGALLLLDRLTHELNILKIPFDFKIAYNTENFDSYDAAVLEFNSIDFPRLRPILKNVYQEHQAYFQPAIPFFCKHLASGLGLAEKPHVDLVYDYEPENIGQYRCGIIAEALIKAWQQQEDTSVNKLDYVLNCLSQARVDLQYLYLNPDSPDIYEIRF